MAHYSYWDEQKIYPQLIQLLQNDKVIVGTSDTILGLLAPMTHAGKLSLDRIKQRIDKPYIVLVRDMAAAAVFSPKIKDAQLQPLLKALWPGPLTVIVRAGTHIPSHIVSPDGTIALRVPDHKGLQTVLASFDGLFSTSANITGEPVPSSIHELTPEITQQVAMVVDDRRQYESKPSTIIDCTTVPARLLREGVYPRATVARYIPLTE